MTEAAEYLKTFEQLENEIADMTVEADRLKKEIEILRTERDEAREQLAYANQAIIRQRDDINTLSACRDRQNERWAESDERLLARNSNNVKLADALMDYIQGLEAGTR